MTFETSLEGYQSVQKGDSGFQRAVPECTRHGGEDSREHSRSGGKRGRSLEERCGPAYTNSVPSDREPRHLGFQLSRVPAPRVWINFPTSKMRILRHDPWGPSQLSSDLILTGRQTFWGQISGPIPLLPLVHLSDGRFGAQEMPFRLLELSSLF